MERGKQLLRQWSILGALERARKGLKVAELQDIVDRSCSTRTLYRDLELLQQAGFPLTNDEGTWSLIQGASGSLSVPVQPTEVLALQFVEELLSPLSGTWLSEPLVSLKQRLLSMLTPERRKYCEAVKRSMTATLFAPAEYEASGDQGALLERVHEGMEKKRRLSIEYQDPKGEVSSRVIEPYATWYASGRLYVVAYCLKAQDLRTFAVQRLQAVEVLDQTYEIDPKFDLDRYAQRGFGVYHGPVHRVVIEFSREVAYLVRERRFHFSQQVREEMDGRVVLTMEAAGLPEISAWVASFGGKARALQPRELRELVIERHRRGLEAAMSSDDVRLAMSAEDVTSDDTGA